MHLEESEWSNIKRFEDKSCVIYFKRLKVCEWFDECDR